MALCHNAQTAMLLIYFGFGHVLQFTPFTLNFSALHFMHSYPAKQGVAHYLPTGALRVSLQIILLGQPLCRSLFFLGVQMKKAWGGGKRLSRCFHNFAPM